MCLTRTGIAAGRSLHRQNQKETRKFLKLLANVSPFPPSFLLSPNVLPVCLSEERVPLQLTHILTNSVLWVTEKAGRGGREGEGGEERGRLGMQMKKS